MTPASIRYNNPGAQWPGPSSTKFGANGYGVIGGGNQIAYFDDPVKGAAAQFDLLQRKYAGIPLSSAIQRWSGGNGVPSYLAGIQSATGLSPDTVLTPELLKDPRVAIPLAQAMAQHEAGRPYPMTDAQWGDAFHLAGGTPVDPSARVNVAQNGAISGGQPAASPITTGSLAPPPASPQGQKNMGILDPTLMAARPEISQGILGNIGAQNPWGMLTALGAGIASQSGNGWGPGIGAGLMSASNVQQQDTSNRINILKLLAEQQKDQAALADATAKFGKAGTVVQGNDGNFYSVQFASDGTRKIEPLFAQGAGAPQNGQVGLSPAKGVSEVDTGTGTRIIDKGTGRDVREISKDVAGEAAAKKQGEGIGQARVDLPKVEQNAASTLRYIDDVLNDENLPNVTGWQARFPTFQSKNVDTEERVAQLGGRAFLSAFESLKGGGQITEVEGKKATDALARITNMKQSDAGYRAALEDFKREVNNLVELARRKAGGGAQPGSSAAPAAADPLGIR